MDKKYYIRITGNVFKNKSPIYEEDQIRLDDIFADSPVSLKNGFENLNIVNPFNSYLTLDNFSKSVNCNNIRASTGVSLNKLLGDFENVDKSL